METITKERFIRILREKSISVFSYDEIFKIFNVSSETAVKALLSRLKRAKIIEPLIRKKYIFLFTSQWPDVFQVANYLYPPSYISLESALSFYGIISQFPYMVTSITVNKARSFDVWEKEFAYAQIKPEYYCDYLNENGILIASKVKAVFDFLYLAYKGGRGKGNLSLMNFSRDLVTKKEVRDYIYETAGKKEKNFIKFCHNQNII